MTDDELAEYLNLKGSPNWRSIVARISPQRRVVFKKMRDLEEWDRNGRRGPPPHDVLVDFARSDRRRRARL